MRVFTIHVLFAGLQEASTQAYGFSWKMSTILWSVRFCLHPCCYTWLSSCRPSCGQLSFVTTVDTFVGSMPYSSSPHHYLVFNEDFRWGVTPCLAATKIRWTIDFRSWDTPRHHYTSPPIHHVINPTSSSWYHYMFVIAWPLHSPLLGKSCHISVLKPILAVPHHGETWRRWPCLSISPWQTASG